MRNWDDTRRDLCRLVARMGAKAVAASIPAGRTTVYRLIKGEVSKPSLAVRDAVEKLVERKKNDPVDK